MSNPPCCKSALPCMSALSNALICLNPQHDAHASSQYSCAPSTLVLLPMPRLPWHSPLQGLAMPCMWQESTCHAPHSCPTLPMHPYVWVFLPYCNTKSHLNQHFNAAMSDDDLASMTSHLLTQGIVPLCQVPTCCTRHFALVLSYLGGVVNTLCHCGYGLHTTICHYSHMWVLAKLIYVSCPYSRPCILSSWHVQDQSMSITYFRPFPKCL